MKHFTIIELGADSESPMVGTVNNVVEQDENFERRVKAALEEHFDAEILALTIPDLFTGSPYEDLSVEIDDGIDYFKAEIRIMETWLY
jgi:mannose/fructose-specific phosphotransferase system component IIA